jgi:RHS repeat-associated protein
MTGAGMSYDANGNTLSDAQGRSFTWDFENRLTQAVVPGTSGGTTTFRYDPFGRRIQKSGPLGTTNHLYDGKNLLAEVDNSGSVIARYTQGKGIDRPLAQVRSGTTSYYEQDGLGSVTSLSNATGALANTYNYDSFGKLAASTGTITNPFQYAGREFDQETGVYYSRARYLDQSVGRFVSEDPIHFTGGTNFYAYTRNNPVLRTDPFGYYSGSGVVGSIYLGPDGVWQNDGPPLPLGLPGGCSLEQLAQSPGACTGPQGQDEPDPWMRHDDPPDPNKKCDKGDQPPDEPPPPQDPIPVIPPILSEGPCATWELADWWLGGFTMGAHFLAQEEIAIPLHLAEATSMALHWELCASY